MDLSRRQIALGLTALATVAPLPLGGILHAAAPAARKPSRLKLGDTVGLIQPASASPEAFDLQLVNETVIAMGLKPKWSGYVDVKKPFGYLAGTDKERAADVNTMFADKDVKTIFAVRGGWGCARILPFLDWDMIRTNPKLLLGYSDITALHMAIAAKGGFVTLHGPNAGSAWGRSSVEHFNAIAFSGEAPLLSNPPGAADRLAQRSFRTQTITGGKARGKLLGGNLTVLTALVGTGYLPDFDGAILFLEDVDEAEYRIDRMLTQVEQAGILKQIKGVAFGQCTDCGGKGGGFNLGQVLEQHFKPLGIPAYRGGWFGHITDQFTLPVGGMVEIDADAGTLQILEPVVS